MQLTPRQVHELYLDWLSNEIRAEQFGHAIRITAPFLDSRNDYLQMFVVPTQEGFVVTDGGNTIRELQMVGVELNTPKRELLASEILNSVSADTEEQSVVIRTSEDTLAQDLQFMTKAVLALGDMKMLAQPTVEAVFWEDVQMLLEENEVEYERRVSFVGRSGYEHRFDFVVPRSNGRPMRLVEAIDGPSKDKVNKYLWTLSDSEYSLPERVKAYAFLNDQRGTIQDDLLEALTSYSVKAVPWSQRFEFVGELRD